MGLTIFAQRMKQARNNKGLKQNELAKAVKVTPTTISAYEKSDTEGNGKKPTLENAQAIAEHLEVSLDWLCGMSDSVNAEYTDFTTEDFFRSLVTIMLVPSNQFNPYSGEIQVHNGCDHSFIDRVSKLIKEYHNGKLEKDLFLLCMDKSVSDFAAQRGDLNASVMIDKMKGK